MLQVILDFEMNEMEKGQERFWIRYCYLQEWKNDQRREMESLSQDLDKGLSFDVQHGK
jgi:hypothetical protein